MEDNEARKTESQAIDIEVLRRWIANCDPTKPIDPAGEPREEPTVVGALFLTRSLRLAEDLQLRRTL